MTQVHTGTFEFAEENGRNVDAARHKNPDGSLGGWVANTATVDDGAYVEAGAIVPPGTHVKKGERIVAEKVTSIEPF